MSRSVIDWLFAHPALLIPVVFAFVFGPPIISVFWHYRQWRRKRHNPGLMDQTEYAAFSLERGTKR